MSFVLFFVLRFTFCSFLRFLLRVLLLFYYFFICRVHLNSFLFPIILVRIISYFFRIFLIFIRLTELQVLFQNHLYKLLPILHIIPHFLQRTAHFSLTVFRNDNHFSIEFFRLCFSIDAICTFDDHFNILLSRLHLAA